MLKLLKDETGHDGTFFIVLPKLLNTVADLSQVYLGITVM